MRSIAGCILGVDVETRSEGRYKGIDMQSVFVFPTLLICMDCGQMESALSKRDLQLLKKESANYSGNRRNTTAA
jgi:hypothetical protein